MIDISILFTNILATYITQPFLPYTKSTLISVKLIYVSEK